MKELNKLLIDIGFVNLEPVKQSINPFIRKLTRIKRGEQKELFLKSMTLEYL